MKDKPLQTAVMSTLRRRKQLTYSTIW